jgi:hypothetical protein
MKNLTDFGIFNFTANGEMRPVYYQTRQGVLAFLKKNLPENG